MTAKDDDSKWKRDAGWRGAGADVARDRTIDALVAQGKLGAAARVAWEGGRVREAADWFARSEMFYEAALCREQLGDPRGAHRLLLLVPPEHKSWRMACARMIVLAVQLSLFDFDTDRLATRFAFAGPLDAGEVPAYLALADHYLAEKFDEAARTVLDRLLGWDPDNAEAHLRLERLRTGAAPVATAPQRRSGPLPALPPLEAIRKPAGGSSAPARTMAGPSLPGSTLPGSTLPRTPLPRTPLPRTPPPEPSAPARTSSRPQSVEVTLGDAPRPPPESPAATSLPRGRPDETINGRYRLLELIGQGGMGVVWRAMDLELGEEIALKILPEPPGSTSWLARIKQELAISRRLTHKNVVRVHDIGTWGTSKVISMELLRGQTVAALLADTGPPPWQHSLEILIQVCAALRAAHDAGVVHRDIKAENVFLCTDGTVKIMDFGIARADGADDGPRVTRAGVIMGTPEYMAPEQIEDAKRAGPPADLYATGILMYELFAGEVPFQGSPIAVLVAHTDRPVPPPRTKVPDLPESIEQTILGLLEKSPEQRIPSATELARRLRTSLRELR